MAEPGSSVSGSGTGRPEAAVAAGVPGRGVAPTTSASKPVVMPEIFDRTKSWEDWKFHFDNVAAVNRWDDAQKLAWLCVRLTGCAQKALQRLPDAARATYAVTCAALKARFDPVSHQTWYQAELQTSRQVKAGRTLQMT